MTQPWTTLDLELFHDGELDPARAAALSDDLRASPELRARLASIACADAAIERVLTTLPARPAPKRSLALPAAIAAALLILAGLASFFALQPVPAPIGRTQVARRDPAPILPEYKPVRIVFSLPFRGPADAPRPADPLPIPDAPTDFTDQLDQALAAGRIDEAIELVKTAGPGDKQAAFRRFGEAMRSSDTATAALDALSAEDQVAACKTWIAAGHQRPFAMARLKMLGRRPELEAPIRLAVQELLADDPNLRTWVMSYLPWTLASS